VCILNDHAGFVGDDGKTHHGVLSVPMMLSIPNLTILAPRDTQEIRQCVRASLTLEGPCVIQYSKDGIAPYAAPLDDKPFEIGRWQRLRAGESCAILAYGRMTKHAMLAAQMLEQEGVDAEVIDCCSIKPMDMACLERLFAQKKRIIVIEEGEMIGGFGSEVARMCVEHGAAAPAAIMGIENRFVAHGSVDQLLDECGLSVGQIAARIRSVVLESEK